MLTFDGPAQTFQQARSIEERFVREAAQIDDPDMYMRQVGDAVAQRVVRLVGDTAPLFAQPHEPPVPGPRADVVAFVGGGDNGGDALYACATLADMGINVAAILLKRKRHSRALRAAKTAGVTIVDLKGGSITTVFDSPQLALVAFAKVWIDGIVGVGGKGALKGNLAEAVEQLNDFSFLTHPAVVSIDVPSGLTDDEGNVKGAVMRATHTMAVGSFKRAQILAPAAQYCGALELIEMEWTGLVGLTLADTEETSGEAPVYFYDGTGSSRFVQAPAFDDDKYARGVVGLVAGSDTYPGAGLLATRGALAAGVGMVRLNSTRRVQDLVLADQPGVVTVGGRIQSALIGPGLDEDRREDALELAQFCGQSGMPLVIDAWALDLVPELLGSLKPDVTVLTPHYGEAARLLGRLGAPVTRAEVAAAPLRYARALHEATGCHVILKGPVTIVYSFEYVDTEVQEAFQRALNAAEAWPDVDALPQGRLVRSYTPTVGQTTTSWAGIAGNGDVLAGFLAGVLARPVDEGDAVPGPDSQPQRVTPGRLAAVVSVHGRAAQVAADAAGGFSPIQASDIAAAIGKVLSQPTP